MNYEPFIERDLPGIRRAIGEYRAEHSSDDLFVAIARFAVLAYAPSQHLKRALLCCLAIHELRDELGADFDDAVAACGVYAAMARQPWSEPPILDPPAVDAAAGADEELETAIASGDRLRAEHWLAARLEDEHLERTYFQHAASGFEDGGDALIVASAAWRLVPILGDKGRFATLRLGIWEMVARGATTYSESGRVIDAPPLLERLIERAVAGRGSPISIQPLLLLNAADDAALLAGETIHHRVRDYLTARLEADQSAGMHHQRPGERVGSSKRTQSRRVASPPVYSLGRDYGSCFLAHAAAKQMRERYPAVDFDPLLDAARDNLASGESFEEWE